MARVVIENLTKVFKSAKGEEVRAVSSVSLTIADGEFLVLVGPSGCGKSTTLRLIAGLEEVSEGSIRIDNQEVNNVPPKDRDLAMVFQNYALYPHMTAFENIAFGLKLRKFPKPEIDRRVREAADILGLTPYLDHKPSCLSGGQRQRVAVGRAIVRKPKVFLFDEPLSNLDAPLRAQMRTEIAKLHSRLGATMIYVTHDQGEAMTMGDRIAVMKEGVIQQAAEPIPLYTFPINRFVAAFIGAPPMNFFRGALLEKGAQLLFTEQARTDTLPTAGRVSPRSIEPRTRDLGSGNFAVAIDEARRSRLSSYVGKTVLLGLRPENISFGGAEVLPASGETGVGPTGYGRENRIEGRVELVESMGAESYVHVSTGAHSFIAWVAAGQSMERNRSGWWLFDMSKAHFFDPITELAIPFICEPSSG